MTTGVKLAVSFRASQREDISLFLPLFFSHAEKTMYLQDASISSLHKNKGDLRT